MTTMVISKFMTNKVDFLVQDIHFDKIAVYLVKFKFF